MQLKSGRTAFSAFPGSALQERKEIFAVSGGFQPEEQTEIRTDRAGASAEKRQQIFGYRKNSRLRQPLRMAEGPLKERIPQEISPFFRWESRRTSRSKESMSLFRQRGIRLKRLRGREISFRGSRRIGHTDMAV